MNNPPSDSASPLLSGDPTSSLPPYPDPADSLLAARRAQRLAEARNLTRRYVLMATGLALLPLPVVDIAALAAIQIKMVHDLAHLYELPFEAKMAKPLLTSLLSCGAVSFGGIALMSLGMSVPGLGTLVGAGFSGSLAGTTMATSEIFIRHFEAGGTLADFDPSAASPASATQAPPSSIPSHPDRPATASGPAVDLPEGASLLRAAQLEGPPPADQGLSTADPGSSATDSGSHPPDQAFSTPAHQDPDLSHGSGEDSPMSLNTTQDPPSIAAGIPDQGQPEGESTQNLDKPQRPSGQDTVGSKPVENQSEGLPQTALNNTTVTAVSSQASATATALADIIQISGIGPVYVRRLREAGFTDCPSLVALKPDALRQILGPRVSLASARDFISQAKALSLGNSS